MEVGLRGHAREIRKGDVLGVVDLMLIGQPTLSHERARS
jgi:hypothetical protein